jgi:hypothetical protein
LKSYSQERTSDICVVIGNGPSLVDVPESFLKAYPTFGVNMIWKMFQPDVYIISGYDQLEGGYAYKKIITALTSADYGFMNLYASLIPQYEKIFENETVYPICTLEEDGSEDMVHYHRIRWSGDISKRFGTGSTVLYIALQAAKYMGFQRALLVGVDNDYTKPEGKHPWKGRKLTPDDDIPHGGDHDQWAAATNITLKMAARAWLEGGGEILNLTPGSKATGIKRGDLNEWL